MTNEKKKRPGHRAYLNDFKPNAVGEYVYTGDLYTCQVPEERRKATQQLLWTLVLAAAVLTVADGCIPAPAMLTVFGIAPFVGQAAAVGSVMWALSRLSAAGDPVRAYVYRSTVSALPRRYVFAMTLPCIGVLGTVIQLLIDSVGENLAWTLLSIGLKLAVGVLMWLSRRRFATLVWDKKQ